MRKASSRRSSPNRPAILPGPTTPEVKEYVEFMKKWVPNDNPGDFVALSGYIIAQGIADALRQCGDDLTRENLLKQATNMKGKHFKNDVARNYAQYVA